MAVVGRTIAVVVVVVAEHTLVASKAAIESLDDTWRVEMGECLLVVIQRASQKF